jgi:hypothetical protein
MLRASPKQPEASTEPKNHAELATIAAVAPHCRTFFKCCLFGNR